ncbi:MAG: nuclear transport factor 2 family protein [Streptomyces sp.]|jgi:ketosteroid isomerase-like protein|nr:nuclear transport factor 2 family protein [Streptomyces sp.]
MTTTEIHDLGQQWAQAEVRGDVAALEQMTTDDFGLVGPLGFVLDKQQWLHRYTAGDLVTTSLTWTDATIREYGAAAVSVGVHEQAAKFQGHPADGKFRITHVFVRPDDRWLISAIHMSPMASTPPNAPRQA